VIAEGIDVSHYQGQIDWQQVAASGISFAFVRAGTSNTADEEFAANMTGAAQAGIRTGVYWYTYAMNTDEMAKEARHVLEVIEPYQVSFPVVLDMEAQCQKSLSRQTLRDMVNVFCQIVYDAGYTPMVYTYRNWYVNRLGDTGWPQWVAMYADTLTMPYQCGIWQYTSHGYVPGIEGRVDRNHLFADYFSVIPREGFVQRDGGVFYYSGYRWQKGWVTPEAGGRYFCDTSSGKVCTGWIRNGGKRYYLNRSDRGRAVTGLIKIDDDLYCFDSEGAMMTGMLRCGESIYLMDSDGRAQTGFYKDKESGRIWYFRPDTCTAATGIIEIDGDTYAFNKEDGRMLKGFVRNGDYLNYFGNDGKRLNNVTVSIDGKECTFDESGRMVSWPEGYVPEVVAAFSYSSQVTDL
jgi:GH25 family lysozyme M1 (1,4-beta-N-acetylmuramidase)